MSSAWNSSRRWSQDEAIEYANLLDLANDAILVIDLQGVIEFWNRGAERLYGYSSSEALDQNAHTLLKTEFPVPLAEIVGWLRRSREWSGELIHTTKSGERVVVSSRWSPRYNMQGELIGTFEINRDITEQRAAREALAAAEQRLQLALTAAKTWWWEYDFETRRLSRSRDVSEVYGLKPGSLRSDDFAQARALVHAEDRHKLDEMLAATAQTAVEREAEFRIILPDGSYRWVLSRGRLIMQAGRPVVVGVAVDVTERKRSEEMRRRTEQLATLGRLAATVAHEINNPLEAINNVLHLLKAKSQDADSTALLEVGQQEVRRIAEIASATLRFAREAPQPANLKMRELLESVAAIFAGRFRSRGIKLQTRFTTDGEMYAAPGELRQIFANLIGNAMDAMERGGTLRIHLHKCRAESRPAYRITISDTGPGIPPQVLAHVFEPFFTTKGDTGTGLGLYVVRELIASYEGRMQLRTRSKPKYQGTTFSILLPVRGAAVP
ncbi:MAG TPA: PAS domain S-box protein [Terriglobales bacterium]|nr:PAS domain S-box protein [Terriglobales bacterium]